MDEQAGFRKGYCTSDNLFILHTIISKYLAHKKGRLYVAFIDFEKAFDRIDHYSMFYKLLKSGVHGKMYKVLFSMYQHVKSCVRTPKGITDFFNCSLGVQQGSVLSPLLFNIFVNDIGETLQNTELFSGVDIGLLKIIYLLFADDLTLVSSSKVCLQRY